ncbi:MAG: primosomal protein N' [Elusimicrobia bacterium]|nr:primosomal protein N' [Elusimicrobiota bacterium]MDE2236685.1 primosomal protein N' [Elusimicrobiota bacterium]MDE2425550.1 primosomal protein N' [Elusimicrobiota bacterium]
MRIAEVACPVPLHKAFHYEVPAGWELKPGERVRVPFGPRRLTGLALSVFEGEPERPLKRLEAVLDRFPALDSHGLECARWLARRCAAPIGDCVKALLPPFIKSLEEPVDERQFVRALTPGRAPKDGFKLTDGQAAALAALCERLKLRESRVALLYGVPASGKTEVYLRLIREAIAEDGQALFLLPEISLTQPFFEEFSACLGVPVVLWHSRLGARQRRQAWLALRRGQARVVVGARSAALLPLPKLRLVVLDEEQDESFKQEGQAPLYHARSLALERARLAGALAVLGSATPSLESWQLARLGRAELFSLPQRVSSTERPSVVVLPPPGLGRVLAEELLGRLRERLSRGEQSILLVNRRGFSTVVMCRKCGWVDRCPHCGVAKIQHEAVGGFELRCHHCERRGPLPAACPKCRNPALRASGVGTQKVVAELRRELPGARLLRFDGDTPRLKDGEPYRRFLNKEADVLVGTKLVAKSFHFPDVTLVGVVDADTMLNMPDFRSSERTMQLLAQVAGRSGRSGKRGEVLLQTLHPEHLAIANAARGDYGAFADAELPLRRQLGYPPYSTLVRLLWTGPQEPAVAAAAEAHCAALRRELGAFGHELVGPAAAVLPLQRRRFRHHALLKCPPEGLEPALLAARALPSSSSVKLKLDVDPYDFF